MCIRDRSDLVGGVAVYHVPVLGGDYGHVVDGEIFVDLIKTGRCAASSAAYHCGCGLACHLAAAAEKSSIHKGSESSGSGSIVDGRTEDIAVCLPCFLHKFIDYIVTETFAVFATDAAAHTACHRLGAHLKNLRLNALFFQSCCCFLKSRISTALCLGASIYQKYFHDLFLLFYLRGLLPALSSL